jgi:hypothetical protein
MTIAHERLDDTNNAKLRGLLEAGDPGGEVRTAWHAKEVVREIYAIDDPDVAAEFVAQLGIDLQDESCPPEVQRLGRTIVRWRHQIAAWHQARHTNAPTEAINNLIKRIKRVAFGITNWQNYRTRALLYAGGLRGSRPATGLPPNIRSALRVSRRRSNPGDRCARNRRDGSVRSVRAHITPPGRRPKRTAAGLTSRSIHVILVCKLG